MWVSQRATCNPSSGMFLCSSVLDELMGTLCLRERITYCMQLGDTDHSRKYIPVSSGLYTTCSCLGCPMFSSQGDTAANSRHSQYQPVQVKNMTFRPLFTIPTNKTVIEWVRHGNGRLIEFVSGGVCYFSQLSRWGNLQLYSIVTWYKQPLLCRAGLRTSEQPLRLVTDTRLCLSDSVSVAPNCLKKIENELSRVWWFQSPSTESPRQSWY